MTAPVLFLFILFVRSLASWPFQTVDSTSNVVSALTPPILPAIAKMLERMQVNLAKTMATFPIVLADEYYVSRPSLEEAILQVYSPNVARKSIDASYTVIVGPKGAGKSSVVAHVLANKPGVLYLAVSDADTEDTILRGLLLINGEVLEERIRYGLDKLFGVFLKAKGVNGRRITVVLEVSRGRSLISVKNSDGLMDMVKLAARKLAGAANVIVMSEANAGLMFGDDSRQRFIWVDGMTHDEASAYAKKLYLAVADHDLELFFDKVGTLPLKLLEFTEALEHGETAANYIESILYDAEKDLNTFGHQQILKELKQSPDGVPAASKFQGAFDKGVNLADPKQVAVAMKQMQAIIYHLPSSEYRLPSRAHRTALLERWKPVSNAGDSEQRQADALKRKWKENEALLLDHMQSIGVDSLIKKSELRTHCRRAIEEATFAIIAKRFTRDGHGPDEDYFVKELMSLVRIEKLQADKLFIYLSGKVQELECAAGPASAADMQ